MFNTLNPLGGAAGDPQQETIELGCGTRALTSSSFAAPTNRNPEKWPTYQEEAFLLGQGYWLVAGMDEAGRGPLAGPVVAGVVILPPRPTGPWVETVRDSKQMTPGQRDRLLPHLRENALGIQTGASTPQEIDELGIVEATRLAMRRALDSLALLPQYLLLDAFPLPGVDIPQTPIVHGDTRCLSIAAASVVAKVTRDRIMEQQDVEYPGYGFARHKGYGTAEHVRSIQRLGPCPIHRYSFAPIRGSGATR